MTPTLEVLEAIEQGLARHQAFGDSHYIRDQLLACSKRRLNKMADRLPVAGELLDVLSSAGSDASHHVVGDTVVRCAIIHAHAQVETNAPSGLPLAQCEEIFHATIRRLRERKFGTPLDDGSLVRLGPEQYHGWIWNDEHASDIYGRSFRYLLKERYDAVPSTPTAEEILLLAKGAQLLQELLPTLSPSALSHAHVLALVPSEGGWKGTASSSQFLLGGTIFLGRPLRNPWYVAEHLLHESTHQKLYDLRYTHSLLQVDLGADVAGRRVPSLWNPQQLNQANYWDAHRVFAAFHVYVHLSLLALVAEQRANELEEMYGPFDAMMPSGKALERAHYLGEQLKEQLWDELGLAGQRMTDWLITALEFMNPSPPPRGAFIHLCLDLYEREANQVAAALRQTDAAPIGLGQRLCAVVREEVEGTRRVLSAIGAREELQRFNEAVAQYTDEELGTRFPEVRRLIGTTLIAASADRYRLTPSGDHDDLLKQMIENASQRLYPILARYPTAVAGAKRRAHQLQFTSSCADDVGRLLDALVSTVTGGGRILEIGTGVGVGTAWITAGLDDRTDVEVVTVEVDVRLSDAARSWPWPAYVQILHGDAIDLLGTLGTFDVVFADAAPVKYGHIEAVLNALRPGGVLVIDDLKAHVRTPAQERAERDTLRTVLLNHPELHVVEVEWSTGVLLATRAMRQPELTMETSRRTISERGVPAHQD